jgi:hypothetical protein
MVISEPLAAASGTSIFVSALFAQAVPPGTRNPPTKAADVTMNLLLFIPASFQKCSLKPCASNDNVQPAG